MSNAFIEIVTDFLLEPLLKLLFHLANHWISQKREDQATLELMNKIRQEHIQVVNQWAAQGKIERLRGFDLAGANLNELDLSQADLAEANLSDVQMRQVNLSGANLTEANFREAHLVAVKLHSADLSLTDFSGATLQDVDFRQSDLTGANLLTVKPVQDCLWGGVKINAQTKMSRELRLEIESKSVR